MLLIIIIFHSFAFLLLLAFLFNVLLNLYNFYFLPSTFSDEYGVARTFIPMVWTTQPRSVYFSGHDSPRELVEEREQRMEESETKMMQIKEKEEELKKLNEKFLMAISTTIDEWVEHANDEGWLTSFV